MKNKKRDFKFRSLQVFILQKIIRKRTKNTSYLNVKKKKKLLAGLRKLLMEKKFLIGRRTRRQPGQSTL